MNGRSLSRRQVLTSAGILAAMSVLWTPRRVLAADVEPQDHQVDLVIDVACLGNSLAANFAEAHDAENGDLRGVGFFVEGYIYPARTIPDGEGFDPFNPTHQPSGHWFCRGWLMFYPERALPHAITTQEYLFGMISDQHPSPANQLVSSGVEGGVSITTRSVIGGTGLYRKARGEVVQKVIGTNTTVLNDVGEQAPNFRFSFKL